MVRALAHCGMGRRIDPSWGGPIELFLLTASASRLVYQMLLYVLSCLWENPCCKLERVAHVVAAGFLSHYLSGTLPYV